MKMKKLLLFSSLTIPFFILIQIQQQVANAQPDNINLCYYYRGMLDAMNTIPFTTTRRQSSNSV